MSSVTSDVCKGGSLSALLAFMRLQVPQHSLHVHCIGTWHPFGVNICLTCQTTDDDDDDDDAKPLVF
jgi:hypothetical protein